MFGFDLDPGDIREQDVDRAAEQAGRLEALLAEQEERLAGIVGTGTGDRVQVKASAAVDGRVLEVVLGPPGRPRGQPRPRRGDPPGRAARAGRHPASGRGAPERGRPGGRPRPRPRRAERTTEQARLTTATTHNNHISHLSSLSSHL
ncbi:hypothetical protein ACFSTC_51970 [Nonomuraea ferruginea]